MCDVKLDEKTICKANSIVLDALHDAGPDGLSLDDLVKIIGDSLQKKEVSMRLNDLFIRDQILKVSGNVWRIKIKETPSSYPNAVKEFVPPSSSELPTINLPGMQKFSSYKNSLQEYCQKMKGPVPNYKSKRDYRGLIGVVSVLSNTVLADIAVGGAKDADQRAAFVALKKLGYIPEKCNFGESVNAGTKRRNISSSEGTPSKQQCIGGFLSNPNSKSNKSALNEIAQKNKLDLAVYETVRVNNGFFTTITFDGRQFKSSTSCAKKRDSEQSAAAVALAILTNRVDEPPCTLSDDQKQDIEEMIKSARAASNTLSLKNRLQEFCQRMKKPFPVYTTNPSLISGHTATVSVDGKGYQGIECQGKKAAEMSAAQVALIELGLMADPNKNQ